MDSIPQHIDSFLRSIAHQNGIVTPRLEISACSGAGDNYVGKVYRALIKDEGSDSEMHLVIKTPPRSKQRRELLRVGVFFQNEANVYEKVLPALAKCYKLKGLEQDAQFLNAPRFYGASLSHDENDVIALEDMRPRGFVMADRRVGLDETHCRLVLTELARLHAASLALQSTNLDLHNNLVDQLTENIFIDPQEGHDEAIRSFCERCRSLIKERFPEGTLERTKFEEFAENYGPLMRGFVRTPSKMSVINHGDTWINNLLFKYNKETGTPEELSLIDFQITRFASPVLDISYLIFASTTKSLRDNHYEKLMEDYHRDLTKFLEELGVDASRKASWELFQEELKNYGAYGWGMAVMVIPLFLADKDNLVSVDEDVSTDSPEKMFLKNPTNDNAQQVERISDLLEDVVRLGYL